MDDLGATLIRAAGWDWGRHVRAGMLFALGGGGTLRVHPRSGGHHHPDEPDPHDVLLLLRRLRGGAPVRLVVDDPATDGWLRAMVGELPDGSAPRNLLGALTSRRASADPP
jgi:hypothetical protein